MKIPSEETAEDAPTPYRYTTPLDQWRQLPEWKRAWFERLSERDLEMIFPTDPEHIDEWMKDRAHTRSVRNAYSRVGQFALTAVVGLLVTAIASAVWLGIQTSLGRH